MLRFELHTAETAPRGSQELLRRVQSGFGFLPTLFAGLAGSSAALAAYLDVRSRFERCSLSPIEQHVVALAASVENGSKLCSSADAYTARRFAGMPADCLAALLDGRHLPDPRLDVLAEFTRYVVRQRGRVDGGDLNVMMAAGYGMEHVLDVVMGVALTTFSNYAAHLLRPPVNAELAVARVSRPSVP
jgi:alkylhydroperoxidase family enzyme